MDSMSARTAWLEDAQRHQDAERHEQAQIARYFAALAANEPNPSQHAPDRMRQGLSEMDRRQ